MCVYQTGWRMVKRPNKNPSAKPKAQEPVVTGRSRNPRFPRLLTVRALGFPLTHSKPVKRAED